MRRLGSNKIGWNHSRYSVSLPWVFGWVMGRVNWKGGSISWGPGTRSSVLQVQSLHW